MGFFFLFLFFIGVSGWQELFLFTEDGKLVCCGSLRRLVVVCGDFLAKGLAYDSNLLHFNDVFDIFLFFNSSI